MDVMGPLNCGCLLKWALRLSFPRLLTMPTVFVFNGHSAKVTNWLTHCSVGSCQKNQSLITKEQMKGRFKSVRQISTLDALMWWESQGQTQENIKGSLANQLIDSPDNRISWRKFVREILIFGKWLRP